MKVKQILQKPINRKFIITSNILAFILLIITTTISIYLYNQLSRTRNNLYITEEINREIVPEKEIESSDDTVHSEFKVELYGFPDVEGIKVYKSGIEIAKHEFIRPSIISDTVPYAVETKDYIFFSIEGIPLGCGVEEGGEPDQKCVDAMSKGLEDELNTRGLWMFDKSENNIEHIIKLPITGIFYENIAVRNLIRIKGTNYIYYELYDQTNSLTKEFLLDLSVDNIKIRSL